MKFCLCVVLCNTTIKAMLGSSVNDVTLYLQYVKFCFGSCCQNVYLSAKRAYLFCFKFAGQFEVEDLKKDFFSKELVKQIYSGYAYN